MQAATGRACTGVLLCLQGWRQGTATPSQREGRHSLMWHPQGTARVHFLTPCHSQPLLHILCPLSAPLSPSWCLSPRGGSHMLLYTILQALCLCSLGNTEYHWAALCHIGSVSKDAERMNATVSTIPDWPQLASRRDRWGGRCAGFFLCLAILPLCTKTRENTHRVLPATVLLT